MITKSYRIITFINSSSAISVGYMLGKKKTHTYEVICKIQTKDFVEFSVLTSKIQEVTSKFDNQYLNRMTEFASKKPTVENLAQVLFDKINQNLKAISGKLVFLQISISPIESYCIEDR